MHLKDPVSLYNGADTVDVSMLQNMLDEAGIQAFVPEDEAQSSVWAGGVVPEFQTPHLWIEREDLERAKPVVAEYERQAAERRADDEETDAKKSIGVTCAECHKETAFPYSQLGSVQTCPACGNFVDVTLDDTPDEQRVMTSEP